MRALLLLWTVGYGLAILLSVLSGTARLPQDVVMYAPLWCLGVGQSLLLMWLWASLAPRHGALRWSLVLVAALAAGAIQTVADGMLMRIAAWLASDFAVFLGAMDGPRLGRIMILYSWTFCLSVTLYWAVGRERATWLAEQRAAQSELSRRQAELTALRLQLNPHFLFNSLNAVSTLVLDGRTTQADKMLMQLAAFLRASLLADPAEMSTLAREQSTLEAYLEIERLRFADRLSVRFEIADEAADVEMPSLLLQPLVENAIKYAVAGAERPVEIVVSGVKQEGFLVLQVLDDGEGAHSAYGAGVGLENIRARLRSHYGEEASLNTRQTSEGFVATIRLPAGA